MSNKKHTVKLDYEHGLIDVKKIVPFPFQIRKYFDEAKLKELGESIQREGLIEPIVVRRKGSRYEIIAGERRFRAVRDYTETETIPAQIVNATDFEARRISAAENLQREDLSAVETIAAIAEMVDSELIKDKEYASMGENPANRVRVLLGKLKASRRGKEREYNPSRELRHTAHKFMRRVDQIFKNLPKPLAWLSFFNNDLPILIDLCKEVREASIKNRLNRFQTRALEKLRAASEPEFQRVTAHAQMFPNSETEHVSRDFSQINIRDLSGREIEEIANTAAKKENLKELNRARVSTSRSLEVKIFMMSRLGIPANRTAALLGVNRLTALKYSENSRLVRSIRSALKKGIPVKQVAKKQGCPEPLVWSIALEGKSDHARFKSLGWGLRTWDHLYFNDVDRRFGDEWPGQIPAQLIAHILYYFSDEGDLVYDPMAGGGVVADTCLAFGRRCWSFDMDGRPDTRPEIEPYFWDITNLKWPTKGKTKPDLILFDPPYFKKQSGKYDPEGISGLSKEKYLEFMEIFFGLAHLNAKKGTRMAFINADWRDFQGIAAMEEDPGRGIFLFDYADLLKRSGWEITHLIDCPLSTQRFLPQMVSRMQKNRTLGVVRRSLIIGRKS